MKPFDMKPTPENVFETFKENSLGRNLEVFRFVDILSRIDDRMSLALEGAWGSGKTFFAKQVQMVISALNEQSPLSSAIDRKVVKAKWKSHSDEEFLPQVCVYYDAWLNDNDDDPVFSLVYSIMQELGEPFFPPKSDLLEAGAAVLDLFTGANTTKVIEALKGENPIKEMQKARETHSVVEEFFNKLLDERGYRLTIIVDELDRCNPQYAVKLLERVKHYLSNERITFVFTVNIDELQNTVKQCYGYGFDACRYLDRFFDLRFSLQPVDMETFFAIHGYSTDMNTYDMLCFAVAKAFGMSLRETTRYLQLTKIAAYKPTHAGQSIFDDGRGQQAALAYIIPIMLGLKVTDTQQYSSFIAGKNSAPLLEISRTLRPDIFCTFFDNNEPIDNLEERLKEVYNAIFIESYEEIYSKKIGRCAFSKETKTIVQKAAGLLSAFACYD